MNIKEVAEIRRRYRPDRSNITHVRGCFVNEQKEIISEFDQSIGMMNEDDAEQMLKLLRKTLSGSMGRNLLDIEFSTKQVSEGEEYELLRKLRDSELRDADSVKTLYSKIIENLSIEGNYLILLAYDRYDVFKYAADGEKREESDEIFSYILCSVCPTKDGKPTLSYYMPNNSFRSIGADTVLTAPELGFMFPAFDDRTTNIYKALYYTKNLSDSHSELVDALFKTEVPMPAKEQKETFGNVLEAAMQDDCSMKVVKSVHGQICRMIEEHKNEKIDEELVMTKTDASDMLRLCGIPADRVEAFEKKFDESFGENNSITPKNIADAKKLKVVAGDIEIKVSGESTDMIETRVIDGVKYVLIRADGDVTVNGVNIHI